jgi:hypothetical protein
VDKVSGIRELPMAESSPEKDASYHMDSIWTPQDAQLTDNREFPGRRHQPNRGCVLHLRHRAHSLIVGLPFIQEQSGKKHISGLTTTRRWPCAAFLGANVRLNTRKLSPNSDTTGGPHHHSGYWPVYVTHIGETQTISPSACSPRT